LRFPLRLLEVGGERYDFRFFFLNVFSGLLIISFQVCDSSANASLKLKVFFLKLIAPLSQLRYLVFKPVNLW